MEEFSNIKVTFTNIKITFSNIKINPVTSATTSEASCVLVS